MTRRILPALLLITGTRSYACPHCNAEIRRGIGETAGFPEILSILAPFMAVTVAVVLLTIIILKKRNSPNIPLAGTSIILGMGLGGFLDGILLHQILQIHDMLSNIVPSTDYVGKSINMFWDGIFHLFCLLVVITGVFLLWKVMQRRDIDRSGRLLGGGMIFGWGVFNAVEGMLDHHLLKLHNVLELSADHSSANNAFLLISVLMLIAGWLIMRKVKAVR